MRKIAFLCLSFVLPAGFVLAQTPAKTTTAAPAAAAPKDVASFGGLKIGDRVVEGWNVRAISFSGHETAVTVAGASEQPFTIVFSLEPGPKGAFDRDDVRIYYRNTTLPNPMIGTLGSAIADRVAAFAASHGGLKSYVTNFTTGEMKSNPEQNVTRETAQRFLERLAGKWNVTALEWPEGRAVPKTLATGTAKRVRFMNDLIVREDAEGAAGRQMMMVGCKPEAGRCWLFVIDNTSSGFQGGWGVFSETENALKVFDETTKQPSVILRVIDDNRNVLEFYGRGEPARVVETIRYERGK